MKSMVIGVSVSLLLGGCADVFLDQAERQETVAAVSSAQVHDDVRTLEEASRKAKRLAYTYVKAARNVSTVQDLAAGTVILSAGATAYGLATDASSRAIADQALPGLVGGLTGRRYASRDTIAAIYAGAQRLNCISAKAGVAASLGELSNFGLEGPALAATKSAMLDAQIITRADIVRESVEFRSILAEFKAGIAGETTAVEKGASERKTALAEYIGELNRCVEIGATKSASTTQSSQVVNPDEPDQQTEEEGIVEN